MNELAERLDKIHSLVYKIERNHLCDESIVDDIDEDEPKAKPKVQKVETEEDEPKAKPKAEKEVKKEKAKVEDDEDIDSLLADLDD